MITTAPLPSWITLLQAARCKAAGEDLAAPWRRDGERALVVGRSAWSLAALAALRGPAPRVALPAWFCNQSLWPLRALGARLLFLPVDHAGRVDWEAAPDADLGILVHPFGFAAPTAAARAWADCCGALLVEDAAHVLRPRPGIGEAGDAVLYSPHKLLALPSGAVLVLRRGLKVQIDAPESAAGGQWLIRRLIQALLPDIFRPLLPQGGQTDMDRDPEGGDLPPHRRPSVLVRRLWGAADLEAEGRRRRANADALRRSLAALGGLRPLFEEPEAEPYRLALLCADSALAVETYAALRRARLPVESWPDLPPEVKAEPERFGAAPDLRRRVLLLPVHGALHPDALAHAYGRVVS